MASASEFNDYIDAGVAALDAGDKRTALAKFTAARVLLASRPDAGKADASLRWDRGALDETIRDLRRDLAAEAVASAGKIRRTRTRYANPGEV
jgi:hypothetical protein